MKKAKLFKNGQSQAVRLPKEFRLPGREVFVKKMGDAIVLFPQTQPWRPLLESVNQFSPDCFEDRSQPEIQKRRGFFD